MHLQVILFIVMQLGASGADAYYTHTVVVEQRQIEHNPIAKPFMHSTRNEVAYFSVTTAVKIAAPIVLRHRHHEKLATALALMSIADNASCAVYTSAHVRSTFAPMQVPPIMGGHGVVPGAVPSMIGSVSGRDGCTIAADLCR